MAVFVSFEGKVQRQALINRIELQTHQQEQDLKFHHSSHLPPREDNKIPIRNNIEEITTDTSDVFKSILPFTKGWIIAKTKKATPKLINPLPSSFNPLNKSIEKF